MISADQISIRSILSEFQSTNDSIISNSFIANDLMSDILKEEELSNVIGKTFEIMIREACLIPNLDPYLFKNMNEFRQFKYEVDALFLTNAEMMLSDIMNHFYNAINQNLRQKQSRHRNWQTNDKKVQEGIIIIIEVKRL
jgi:hypothetical protein